MMRTNLGFFPLVPTLLFLLYLPLRSEMTINLQKLGVAPIADFQVSLTDTAENRYPNKFVPEDGLFNRNSQKNADKKVIWIQKRLSISGEPLEYDHTMLRFVNFSPAFEVFWDGETIGGSGKISGSGDIERSGDVMVTLNLSGHSLSPGVHTLSIRLYHNPSRFAGSGSVYIGYHNIFRKVIFRNQLGSTYYFGFFVVLAFICFSLYFTGSRNPSYFYFGIYSGFYSLSNLWKYFVWEDQVSIKLFNSIFPLMSNRDEIFAFILVMFLLWHFNVKKKRWTTALLGILLIIILAAKHTLLQDVPVYSYFYVLPFHLIAIYISFKCFLRKITGSLIALLSFSIFALGGITDYILGPYALPLMVQNIFISFFYLTLLLSVIVHIQTRSKKAQEVLVRSKRLEAELLKKSIQPHFILNTLLSLKSLIVSGGDKAEKLIDSLADEFNLIREISSESKITLRRELELCRLHLKIMGFRRYAEYRLRSDCEYPDALIPPLIIHTLVENGITHSFKPEENGVFKFRCRKEESRLRIRIQNNGSLLEKRINATPGTVEEGTGIRYIKSRLQETYGRNWDLDYGISGDSWMVEIAIPFEEKS